MTVAGGFEEFFARLYVPAVRVLWGYCGDREVAEEAAQEAFLRASRDWARVAEMASPAGWLLRVAINEVNRHYRRAGALQRALTRHGNRRPADPNDVTVTLSVQAAMARLPDRQRTAVALHYFADLPVGVIANVMGVPVGTVKSLLSRGRAGLRGQLSDSLPDAEVNDVH